MIKKIEMNLHPHYERHLGHCQITYTSRNDNGERLTYCLQDNGEKFGGIRLMRCSDDGEPSHEVKFTRPLHFEKTKGDSRTEILANQWIENYEKAAQ